MRQQNQSVQDWEDEGTTLARQFSTVLVYDAEEGVWRPTDASWKHLVLRYFIDLKHLCLEGRAGWMSRSQRKGDRNYPCSRIGNFSLVYLHGDSFDLVNVGMFDWHPCVSSLGTKAFPQLPTPRTAMALCVAPGMVASISACQHSPKNS